MGSLSFGEILTILVVILVIFGPSGLPEIARKLGTWMAKAREATRSITSQIEREYGDDMEPIRELKDHYDATKRDLSDAMTAIGSAGGSESSAPPDDDQTTSGAPSATEDEGEVA